MLHLLLLLAVLLVVTMDLGGFQESLLHLLLKILLKSFGHIGLQLLLLLAALLVVIMDLGGCQECLILLLL